MSKTMVPKDAQRTNNLPCSFSSSLISWPLNTVCWLWEYPSRQGHDSSLWFQMAMMTVWGEERCRLVLTRVAWCLFGSFCLWAGMVGIKEVGNAEFINERHGKQ